MATPERAAQPPYRAGIIGCGRIGGYFGRPDGHAPGLGFLPYNHASTFLAHPRTHLVAAADLDPDRLARFGETWNLSPAGLYADYLTMIEQDKLDIVALATPSRLHHDMLLRVLASPIKGIFLEKP